jgi:hypothetical protein
VVDTQSDSQEDSGILSDERRERRRTELLEGIPKSYSYKLHLAIPSLLTAGICAVAVSLMGKLRAIELLMVPAMFLISNLGEWIAHRYILHKRLPLLGEIYVRHELEHHQVYIHSDMSLRHPRELQMILIPAYAVLVMLVSVVPFAVAAGLLLTKNCAMLVIICSLCYFIVYEWLHLSYHLPPDSRIGRLPIIARLRRLHQTHHDPRLMKRYNFNVTVGFFDWINGTLYDPERKRACEARRQPEAAQ